LWILCIQETKPKVVNDFGCASMWENSGFGYSYRPYVGAFVGILTLWDSAEVDVWVTRSLDNVVVIQDRLEKKW